MGREKIFNITKFLSIIGILLAVYLLWEQFTRPTVPFCSINQVINCDPIISGELSRTAGTPTPLIGLAGYLVILYAAIQKNKKLILGMASFGLLFCLWIGARELIGLRVICPICISCQLVMIIIFILSILNLKKIS